MRFTATFAAAVLASVPFAAAMDLPDDFHPSPTEMTHKSLQSPASTPQEGTITSVGCYSSKANMTSMELDAGSHLRASSGNCRVQCKEKGFSVIALQGTTCYCGNAMPSKDDLVKDDECNYPCPGFGAEACGSIGEIKHYSIFNLGIDVDPPVFGDKGSDNGNSKPSSKTLTGSSMATPTSTLTGSSTSGSTTPSGTGPNSAATSTGAPDNGSAAFNYSGVIGTVVVGLAFALI